MAYRVGLADAPNGSYSSLLQAFRAKKESDPPRKKRKLNGLNSNSATAPSRVLVTTPLPEDKNESREQLQSSQVDKDVEARVSADESEDEDHLLEDPFQHHYVTSRGADIAHITQQSAKKPKATTTIINDGIRKTWTPIQDGTSPPDPAKRPRDLHIKQRLLNGSKDTLEPLGSFEEDFCGSVCTYHDVISGFRTVKNAGTLRDVCMLHCLNHIFKTRDRVLKNNAKISQASNDEPIEARDQGFARPKVLIIVPTKQSCVRFVESIVKLSEPDQQENKSRFSDQFSRQEEDEWQDKPDDFRELFGGNHEEDFRIGLKFTRKTIKYFSGFYNSDIIIASPLGLRRSIESSSKTEDEEKAKTKDSDFLSSIEIAVVDNASALQMQNWEHVENLFSNLNLLPRESHGCDFSRVRHWYLDGHAKYLRQTIILSNYLTPEINSLAGTYLQNIAGRVRYLPVYKGTMVDVPSLLPLTVHQTFIRFNAATAVVEPEARFKLFATTILPQWLRDGEALQGALIFVPSYSDFVRLRNYLNQSFDKTAMSFGGLSEYTPVKEVNRTRSHFISGRHNMLLYSERAHHHFRYRLRGVRKILFYGVPENPIFWSEVAGMIGTSEGSLGGDSNGKGLIRAMFSRWDAMKLERVVGTERVSRLLLENSGDTFEFA